jgi:hypothetical protein
MEMAKLFRETLQPYLVTLLLILNGWLLYSIEVHAKQTAKDEARNEYIMQNVCSKQELKAMISETVKAELNNWELNTLQMKYHITTNK